jgi:hypothetical protein
MRGDEKRPSAADAADGELLGYLCILAHLVFFRIFLYLCLRIFFRRFFTTDDINPPRMLLAIAPNYSMGAFLGQRRRPWDAALRGAEAGVSGAAHR